MEPEYDLIPEPAKWRLSKDLAKAAEQLTAREARYLVDLYYQTQKNRIRAANQSDASSESGEPNALLGWIRGTDEAIEGAIKLAMGKYAKAHRVGRWSMAQTGIGPVLAAGLLAHIDIKKAPTVGHIWSFAGLDPTKPRYVKGQTRTWNAHLKVLCWKIGDSFMKNSGRDTCFYGKVYAERLAQERAKNEEGLFRDQAEKTLAEKKFSKDTLAFAAYSKGQLPAARILLRAQRYAVKLFLAHWHHVAHIVEFGVEPPKPYVIAVLGHAHLIEPPHWPID